MGIGVAEALDEQRQRLLLDDRSVEVEKQRPPARGARAMRFREDDLDVPTVIRDRKFASEKKEA